MYSIELIFECDRCLTTERSSVCDDIFSHRPTLKFYAGGCHPTVRAHQHLPEGWEERARPEALRREPGWEEVGFYEHICSKCQEKNQ